MRNIADPVAIPSGGITIFLSESALRASRTRHVSTATKPIAEAAIAEGLGRAMAYKAGTNLHFTFWFKVETSAPA
jgi:hypothetical protein